MFSLGWGEFFLIIALGFLLFKPQEFPSFFRTIYSLYQLLLKYFQHLHHSFHNFAEEMEIEAIKHDRSAEKPPYNPAASKKKES